MNRAKFIDSICNELNEHSKFIVSELYKSITNQNEDFKPYNSNPKIYTLSIYEPLELSYTLFGNKNYWIRTDFNQDEKITDKIISFHKLIGDIIEDEFDKKVITTKREIEYIFLKRCLNKVEKKLNKKIQLYLTQHITEITFDISNMNEIESEQLWEILEN